MFLLVAALAALHQPIRSDSAYLAGSTVVIEPLGISVDLPPEWFGTNDTTPGRRTCGHVVHGPLSARARTTRAGLDSVRNAHGEWDREYSAVTDSILSFSDLIGHFGPEPFGNGACFLDLQFRVYVTNLAPPEISQRVVSRGLPTARALFPNATQASLDSAAWHIDRLRWDARYADYGGEANVEIYSTVVNGRTLSLVFLHATFPNGPAGRDERYILEHVRR